MIEAQPEGSSRPMPSPVPIVSLATASRSASGIAQGTNAEQGLVHCSKQSSIANDAGFLTNWFQVVAEALKTLASARVRIHFDPRCLLGLASQEQFSSQGEVVALQTVVAEVREELRASQQREKSARYLAFHDDLTALPNRRLFCERLERALANSREAMPVLAVLYVDLDGFKALNDMHGHAAGDKLLNLVATRLCHVVRAEDLVSRLGGDEFACLIAGVSSRDRLQQIAAALFEAVSHPFTVGTLALTMRPSIGIAMYPNDGITADALLQAADSAMYAAKRSNSMAQCFEHLAAPPQSDIVSVT